VPSVSPQPVPEGPVRRLFEEIRRLHRTAGEPSTRTLAKATAHGHATVHAALRGPKVPRWGLLELLVEHMGGNVAQFKQLWVDARDFEDPHERQAPNPTHAIVEPDAEMPVNQSTRDDTGRPPVAASQPMPLTLDRIKATLQRLAIHYMDDRGVAAFALWERHAVLFTLEGPEHEILVMRARPHGTVAPEQADRARTATNEWNRTRRFMKAYIGELTDRGQLPILAEMQLPLKSGITDEQLTELLDSAAHVAMGLTDWLHGDGKLL
jgi:hypothetical protein